MKIKIFLPLIILALFFLGSCETIEIEKLIYDTVYVDKPIRSLVTTTSTVIDTVIIRDTVRVEVVVHDTIVNNIHTVDTVLQYITKDSLIIQTIEKVVNHYDTIVLTDTVYQDVHHYDTVTVQVHDTIRVNVVRIEQRVIYTERYSFPGQSVFYLPEELKPFYDQYIADAQSRGIFLPGGDVVFGWVDPAQLPGENWSSVSWEMSGSQWVILIDETLPIEQSKACMYRELTRWQLRKKYSNNINAVMSPLFRTSPDPTTSEINTLFQ